MKKLLLAAVATAFVATPALADDKADISVSGVVALSCTVTPDTREVTNLDLNLATEQTVGSLTYKCNGANGFTRTIASDNKGQLNHSTGASKGFVPYTISGTGSPHGIPGGTSLQTDYVNAMNSSYAFVNGQTAQMRLTLAKPASATGANPLYAGTYSDVIRVSIPAN